VPEENEENQEEIPIRDIAVSVKVPIMNLTQQYM
jgi:hypothetical protein